MLSSVSLPLLRTIGRTVHHDVSGVSKLFARRSPIVSLKTAHSRTLTSSRPLYKEDTRDTTQLYKPSELEKVILVKARMFPDKESVPDEVSHGQMKKAHDMYRVRVSLWMIVATAIVSVFMIWSGKRLSKMGDSLEKRGLKQIAEYKEQGVKERAEKEAVVAKVE